MRLNPLLLAGAGGRNRTDTGLPPRDFESRASTSFTTPAIYSFVSYAVIKMSTQEDNYFAVLFFCVLKTCKKLVSFTRLGIFKAQLKEYVIIHVSVLYAIIFYFRKIQNHSHQGWGRSVMIE
jgi:hypothetical protein